MDEAVQRERIMQHLERRNKIEVETKAAQAQHAPEPGPRPLEGIDPDLFAKVEEEFHNDNGRQKYVSSDGRVRWLTAEEIDRRKNRRKKDRRTSRYYGPQSDADRREYIRWGFSIFAVMLAVAIVWLVVL